MASRWLQIVRLRARSLFRRRAVEQDLERELRAHLDLQVEEYIAHGMTPDDARHATLREFGGVARVQDDVRDTWDNVWSYTTIPSVREIVVVHSTRVFAELLRRGADGNWPAEPEEIGLEGTLRLDSIGFACPLPAVYAQTRLA